MFTYSVTTRSVRCYKYFNVFQTLNRVINNKVFKCLLLKDKKYYFFITIFIYFINFNRIKLLTLSLASETRKTLL